MLSGTYVGVDYTDWMRLCDLCKRSVIEWYFSEVFVTEVSDRPSKDLFELEIEEDNAAIDWDNAYNEYERMTIDYRENDDTIITKEELVEMKECCEGRKLDWKDAYERLQSNSKNLESESISNDGIKDANQGVQK